jgi:excisionase family DNA binding protein
MPDAKIPRKLLNISEAAAMLGVSVGTVRAWADKGLIPHQKLPSGYRRFTEGDIAQVLADMNREVVPQKKRAA